MNNFAIVGLGSEDLRAHASKHDFFTNTYTPKVLSYFPHSKNFDGNAVCTMCLPDGLHLKRTPFPEDDRPEFHSFLITKEDGSRIYGCALSFYEVCTDQKLLEAITSHQQITENALIVSESDEKRGGSLCVQKCICLTSSFPHVSPLKQYLIQLHRTTIGGEKLSIPFEMYLTNLLYDVPAPLPGKSIQFHAPLSKLTCKMPGILEFPLCDYSLLSLIQKIGLKNLVKVLTCMLLEHQLLITSESYSELMECSEWLTALLCPFTWQHVYVPILPASLHMFLDAPVPYIMGIKPSGDFSPDVDITNEGSMCMLDLSLGTLQVPEDMPAFPDLENFLGRLQEVAENHHIDCTDLREFSLSPTQSHNNQTGVINFLQTYFHRDTKTNSNEEIVKLARIATRAGIEEEVTSPASSITSDVGKHMCLDLDEVDNEMFTVEVREAFIQRFVDLLRDYEKFTIYPKQTYDQWKRDREQFQNFDRTAFLSDQPEKYLPFLSAFLETQMFRAFIDEKIETYYNKEPTKCLTLFDNKIDMAIKERSDLIRSPVFEKAPVLIEEPCSPAYDSGPALIEVPPPPSKPLEDDEVSLQPLGVFPNLDLNILQLQRSSSPSLHENTGTLEKKRMRRSMPNEPSSRQLIQRHAKFVMQLWRESRVRVKNMVGSSPNAKSSVEENTQIANLCDLLERIWSHGLVAKREGKSPLWSHLMAYAETDTTHCESLSNGSKQPRSTSPKTERIGRSLTPTQNFKVQLKRKSLQSPELRERVNALLSPPAVSLIDDILTIKMMSEIKTDVGRTRAWVRLALEKKLLYKHLVELLSNKALVDSRYKDYAFLRTEDEKEQFLLHILTLNAKDFSCFTRGFKDSSMRYRVLIVGEGKHFGLSTACLYCNLAGKYTSSGNTWFTKGEDTVDIKCQNLGPIMCIRIGHDNAGLSPSTWIDSVLVQNMTTGRTYHFPCHQWLSRTEGDCSTDRFLVAKKLDYDPMVSPPSVDSLFPSENGKKRATKKDSKELPVLSVNELNHNLETVVHSVVGSNESDIDQLNCLLGLEGFVYCLEQVLLFGVNTNRKRKLFLWDLVEKMSTKVTCMHEADKVAAEKLLSVVSDLNNQTTATGKVEKFHILVCAGISNQLLATWINLLARSSATSELYAPGSYLLDKNLLEELNAQLHKLSTVNILIPALLSESLS